MAYVDKKASSIGVTPGSIITSTNLQDAIDELDTELALADTRLDTLESDVTAIESNITTIESDINDIEVVLAGLGENPVPVDHIEFSTTPIDTASVAGKLIWNNADGTLEFGLKDGDVTLQIGQETVIRAVNRSGVLIPEGAVVRLSGAHGQRIKVDLADASSAAESNCTIGIVTSTGGIAHTEQGYVTVRGLVRGLDVRGYAEGTQIWLSTVAGEYTNVEPVAPDHSVSIGYVVKANPNGSVYVSAHNGTELSALHDVTIGGDLVNGDFLVYNSLTGVWENSKYIAGEVTVDGLILENTVWDDLRFPAQAINPPGSGDAPPRSTTTGLLDFSGTTDNVIMGVAQMPHAWKEGTAVGPHLHLRFPTSTATNTRWKLEYDIANVSGSFTNASGTFTDGGTITIANPQDVSKHVVADFADITMTGKTLSAIIVWKITRLASSDAADTYTGVASLMEFDIHYEMNRLGSDNEYSNN